MLSRWHTAMKVILLFSKIKKDIPFKTNISAVINTSLWSFTSSLGIIKMPPATWICFFLVVFPFKAAFVLPQIACVISIYWTLTVKSTIFILEQST